MKIGILTISYLPSIAYGGVASIAAEQARELALRGHQVTILTSNVLDPHKSIYINNPGCEICESGYQILRFSSITFARRFSGIFSGEMLRWISQHAKEFDIFHIHYARGLMLPLSVELLLALGKKIFLQTHGMLDRTDGIRGWIDRLVVKRQLERANGVFALQTTEQKQLEEISAHAIYHILPNGIRIPSTIPSQREHEQFPLKVLFLGRLHPRKRVLAFVQAAVILLGQRKDLRFRIIGPDEGDEVAARELVQRAQLDSFFEFAGAISHDRVLMEFARANVYVLPANNEPFGLTLVEALLVGTPCVITNSFHIASMLGDAVEISEPDPTSLANSIEKLLNDPDLCRIRSARGKKLVREHFTIERIVDLLEDYYNS